MKENSSTAEVIFTSLPTVPDELDSAKQFIDNLNALSGEFPYGTLVLTISTNYIALHVAHRCGDLYPLLASSASVRWASCGPSYVHFCFVSFSQPPANCDGTWKHVSDGRYLVRETHVAVAMIMQ